MGMIAPEAGVGKGFGARSRRMARALETGGAALLTRRKSRVR